MFDTLKQAVEGMAAKKVFGEPITRDDVTIIPVAMVKGGGGGGGGGPSPDDHKGGGSGGGFGVRARPAGVFAVRDAEVSWRPAVDVNRIVLGGQLVAVVALLTIRSLVKARRR